MFSLSQAEQALRTGDIGDVFDNPASPPPSSPARRGVESIIDGLNGLDPASDKPQLMADLMDLLNYPTPETEGLTPLHWLGLNPLVILGAPAGHYGPSSPPPPPPDFDALFAKYFTEMTEALRGMFTSSFVTLARQNKGNAESLERLAKRSDFLKRLIKSTSSPPIPQSTPSSAPSPTPVAAPAQDVEMAHPPAPAPVPPPAPAPAAPVPDTPTIPPVSKPRAKKPRAQPPTPAPAKASPAPVPAPAPVSRPTPPPSKPSFASMAKTPARPSLVVSLRPPVAGASYPPAVRRSPQEIVSHLNAVLASEDHQVTLSAARWTAKNNLVVTAGPDTTAHHLTSASHLISDCLATFLSADQSPLPVQTRENCKWARLLVNGIPTGVSLTRGPFSPSELHAALLADNPAYRGLRLTQPPSWVRAPSTYTPGSVSSLVLTFEDPSGDSSRSLLAERSLFAFGHSGELKRWKAKPRSTAKPPASAPPP
ncbi:hypothetical protein EDB85DRAFT_1900352 [Lactarius pseudohatsudake]|nr:hypothetical protein EDB85DRAFT_1900352 [Lactarius pseudohatsudake]